MKTIAIGFSLVVVAACQVAAPRSGGWMGRHQQYVERVRQVKPALLMIGDSITQNYEKANPPYEDFKPTWDRFYAPRRAVNLGISGDLTSSVLWRMQNGEIDGIAPKAAVILIGTNDTLHGATAEQTEAGIDAIVKVVHEKLPATKILLLGILPSHISDAKTTADQEVNRYLARQYGKSPFVTYLDIGDIFKKDGRIRDELFYDSHLPNSRGSLHPDSTGQRMMAEAIEPVLAKLMGEK
jgi:lysophospholipase L1-like esterase